MQEWHQRDIVELYTLSTGQSTGGLPATMKPVTMAQSGGVLYNQGTGGGFSGSSAIDQVGAGVASNAGPLVIKLDGPATTTLLRGEAVQAIAENPRAVQAATLVAMKASAGRRQATALQMSPGTIIA
jgi:hypothetical protein